MNINELFKQDLELDLSVPTPRNLKPLGTFYAKSSLSEKLGRVFNIAMFSIVIFQTLKCLPKIKDRVKIPNHSVIATLIKYKIHWIPSLLVARKICATLVGFIVYPATLMTVGKDLNPVRNQLICHFERIGYKIQSVTLNKAGINFDAFLIGSKDTLSNRKWVQIAGGNGFVGESVVIEMATRFERMNILYVNGPRVGRSTGFPTTYAMGAAQDAGLQLLEGMKASKILLYGTSLGGGAQARAFKYHKFVKDVQYMVWSDRSFDNLTNAASSMVMSILKVIFPILGIDLDGVAGARRLNHLGIRQIVTNNYQGGNVIDDVLPTTDSVNMSGTDGVIPNEASLYTGIRKILHSFPNLNLITFFGNEKVYHNGDLAKNLNAAVFERITGFFN